MRAISKLLAAVVPCALASPALAGITVTSYRTLAQVNGYAPTSQTQFFEQQTLTNVSPANAQVSGDWMGPNAGGSTPTWHYVGSAQTTSTTAFDADSLTITAAGSFAYVVDTTADFVDPSSTSIYGPGAAANYRGFFETDTLATYGASVQLNQHSGISLGSFEAGFIFNHFNAGEVPVLFQLTGIIPPGHYQILVTSGVGAPNLPNGINHILRGGSFENTLFTVQVPEPNALGVVIATTGITLRRRKGCARAGYYKYK